MSTNRRLVTIASVAAVLILITAGVAFGVRLLLHTATSSSTEGALMVSLASITRWVKAASFGLARAKTRPA